jgi:cytochrome c-type biogenesis protein
VLIIAMGVFLIAAMFVTRLNQEWHMDALMERAGRGGPIVVGAAFAFAWTPCIGPTLGAILTLASTTGSAAKGAILLTVY